MRDGPLRLLLDLGMNMKRTSRTLAATLLVACGQSNDALIETGAYDRPVPGSHAPEAPAPPNVVLIVVDDVDRESINHVDGLLERMADRGVRFNNAFSSQAVCCPSRVSMLIGQYAHNHRINRNFNPAGGPSCSEEFQVNGYEAEHVGVWFQAAGFRTGMVGKYLNRFPGDLPNADPTRVVGGWDDWQIIIRGGGREYYNYTLNENGTLVEYGDAPHEYVTTVLGDKAVEFVRSSGAAPFFLKIATTSAHSPNVPPPDRVSDFAGLAAPRTPSWNEADMSDKPVWFRDNLPLLSAQDEAYIDSRYRDRLRGIAGVADMLARIDDALIEAGAYDRTVVAFLSDNGNHQGHHRFRHGKDTAYEPSIGTPFLIRGPGIPAGVQLDHLVTNVDLPATLATLAGVPVPGWVDGRSLTPLLTGTPPTPQEWRRAVLLEHPPTDANEPGIPDWWGLRLQDASYVEYVTGEREYYDLTRDPDQMENAVSSTEPGLIEELAQALEALRKCDGPGQCG